MAIDGHKERALLRRGIQVKEALQRRPMLNEISIIRRGYIFEDSNSGLNLNKICKQKTLSGVKDSIYCSLTKLLNELPSNLAKETHDAILSIYEFFKPGKRDNRTIFVKIMKVILKNENPANSLKLISQFLNDPDFKDDDVKKALVSFRKAESIPEAELEEFLKKARFKEYTKYEESFNGKNFELLRGKSKLSHGQINPETGKPETFFKLVESVYNGKIDMNYLIKSIAKGVLNTDVEDLLYKSDLKVLKDLKVDDYVVIPKGSNIEVKKFDYQIDSYFSEYFAIYKSSSLPKIAYTKSFRQIYNEIIKGVFKIVQKEGQFMIDKISKNVDGIIFENNLIVLKNDIEFYWSDKGQRSCNDLRLSIRFRVKNPKITTYIYDSKTHSDQLTVKEMNLSPKPKVFC